MAINRKWNGLQYFVWATKSLQQYWFWSCPNSRIILRLQAITCGAENARFQRWFEFLAACNYKITHRKQKTDVPILCYITMMRYYFPGLSGIWPRKTSPSVFSIDNNSWFVNSEPWLGWVTFLVPPDYTTTGVAGSSFYHGYDNDYSMHSSLFHVLSDNFSWEKGCH